VRRGVLALFAVLMGVFTLGLGLCLWHYHGPAAFTVGVFMALFGWQARDLAEHWRGS
jgi:hypothetical protein